MDNEILLHLTDRWRRPIDAEMRIHRDTVEMYCDGRNVGVADRDYFRQWLRERDSNFIYDDLHWLPTPDGVLLAIGEKVPAWPLADRVLAELLEKV